MNTLLLLTSLLVTLLAILAKSKLFIDPKCQHAEQFFSADYYDARARFRHAASSLQLEQHTLPLNIPDHDDLTIDVAIYRGNAKRVLIHISGTHGVEGFVGSAVQNSILGGTTRKFWETAVKHEGTTKQFLPTVVFVHALNPYGFAKLRRFNENNVDLNRNYLSTQQFIERLTLDPNRHGYVDFYNLFNPQHELQWNDAFLPVALYHIIRYGYVTMKKALVTGTYHHPKGIFYGGGELQQSHVLLADFLKREIADMDKVEKVGILDVHSGLGPKGFDTLMSHNDKDKLLSILKDDSDNEDGIDIEKRIASFGTKGSAGSGYDDVVGDVKVGLENLFSSSDKKDKEYVSITQEFGTASPISVSQALRKENQAYWFSPWNRIDGAQALRGVFYLHNDPKWKLDIVTRGADVFWKIFQYLEVKDDK